MESQNFLHDDELFDNKAAAEDLKVSPSWLNKSRIAGDGPEFVRIGKSIRYTRGALRRYKAENSYRSTSEYERGAE